MKNIYNDPLYRGLHTIDNTLFSFFLLLVWHLGYEWQFWVLLAAFIGGMIFVAAKVNE